MLYTYCYKLATKYATKVSCRYKKKCKEEKTSCEAGEKDVNVVDFSTPTQTTDKDIFTYLYQVEAIKHSRGQFYMLLDTRILNKIVCFRNIEGKRGLAHFIELPCTKCNWCTIFSTSEEAKTCNTNNEDTTKSPGSGRHAFDINIRSVIARREIGRGYTALQTLSVATEVRKVDGGQQVTAVEVVSTTISTDGTSQKRGFS